MPDVNKDPGGHDHESGKPIPPDYPFPYLDPNPWLPKTDWSRDNIIASDD